jgi:hypothetical protein
MSVRVCVCVQVRACLRAGVHVCVCVVGERERERERGGGEIARERGGDREGKERETRHGMTRQNCVFSTRIPQLPTRIKVQRLAAVQAKHDDYWPQ